MTFFAVVNLQDAGYPRTWGQGFKAIPHVSPDLVPLPPADELPRLMTEFAATCPVRDFLGKFHFIPIVGGIVLTFQNSFMLLFFVSFILVRSRGGDLVPEASLGRAR